MWDGAGSVTWAKLSYTSELLKEGVQGVSITLQDSAKEEGVWCLVYCVVVQRLPV